MYSYILRKLDGISNHGVSLHLCRSCRSSSYAGMLSRTMVFLLGPCRDCGCTWTFWTLWHSLSPFSNKCLNMAQRHTGGTVRNVLVAVCCPSVDARYFEPYPVTGLAFHLKIQMPLSDFQGHVFHVIMSVYYNTDSQLD